MPLRLEIVRACPGLGFSMLGDAVQRVGRRDIFVDLPDRGAIDSATRPVLVIPAGGTWNFLPSGTSRGAAGMLQQARETLGTLDGLTVAFDCAGEGFHFNPDIHAAFAGELAHHGLDASRCYLITSRTDGRAGYERWCRSYGQAPLFEPVYSPVQLYYYSGPYRAVHDLAGLTRLVRERSPSLSGIRPRKYVCLNFMPRDNRWAVVLRLMQDGLLDQGFVSFQGRSEEAASFEGEIALDVVKHQLKALRVPDALIDRVDELDAMAPLELDEPKVTRIKAAYDIADQAYYCQSYFSIVTESDFSGQAGLRFSEKLLKPIANLQPFVSIATPGVMAELRRLGFMTFAPLIDESYDTIEDPASRLESAIEAALTLIRLSPSDLHALYAELWPRLVHNYLHFLCATPGLIDRDEALIALSASR